MLYAFPSSREQDGVIRCNYKCWTRQRVKVSAPLTCCRHVGMPHVASCAKLALIMYYKPADIIVRKWHVYFKCESTIPYFSHSLPACCEPMTTLLFLLLSFRYLEDCRTDKQWYSSKKKSSMGYSFHGILTERLGFTTLFKETLPFWYYESQTGVQ